jgi:hypothetical protein
MEFYLVMSRGQGHRYLLRSSARCGAKSHTNSRDRHIDISYGKKLKRNSWRRSLVA